MPTIQKNTKIANRYGLNIRICDSNDTSKVYQTIDFANISSLDLSGDTVYARGGARQEKRIGFYDKLVGEFTLSTQILTNDLLCLMTGSTGNWDGESPITFKSRLLEKVRTFTLFGDTVWKDEDGNVYAEEIVLHKVRPRIAYNRSYDGSGDVASVDIVFDLMEDENGLVFSTGKGSELNVVAGTLISTYGAVDINSVWDLGTEGVVEDNVLYLGEEPEDIDPPIEEALLGTWTLNPSDFDTSMVDSSLNSAGWDITALALVDNEVITLSFTYLILFNGNFGYQVASNGGGGIIFLSEYPNIVSIPNNNYISNAENNRWAELSTFTINSVPAIDETNLSKIFAFLQANATKQ